MSRRHIWARLQRPQVHAALPVPISLCMLCFRVFKPWYGCHAVVGIFNVRTGVDGSDCTRGLSRVRTLFRESALKADPRRKIPSRTGESN